MKDELSKMIRKAQRQLRVASGAAMTVEELNLEKREKGIEGFETAMAMDLGFAVQIQLSPFTVRWDGENPSASFVVDDLEFELRRDEQGTYTLSTPETGAAAARLNSKGDALFRERFLAAIGSALAVEHDR